MIAIAVCIITFFLGAFMWTLWEYLLHRFAMHELNGKGIMSREHLEHHVKSSWSFDYTHILSWLGIGVVGSAVWFPLAAWITSQVWSSGPAWAVGISMAIGWACGYAFYEYQHAASHLRAPKTEYQHWLRKHHFHHHFGHPKMNHGVTTAIWDKLFGTLERPEKVRVPRRLAMVWLVDDDGNLHDDFAHDYELVGSANADHRQEQVDRAKAFASIAPDP